MQNRERPARRALLRPMTRTRTDATAQTLRAWRRARRRPSVHRAPLLTRARVSRWAFAPASVRAIGALRRPREAFLRRPRDARPSAPNRIGREPLLVQPASKRAATRTSSTLNFPGRPERCSSTDALDTFVGRGKSAVPGSTKRILELCHQSGFAGSRRLEPTSYLGRRNIRQPQGWKQAITCKIPARPMT